MSFVAFLDACVIYPAALRDVLLTLASEGLFQVRWSPDVLDEMERNVAARPAVDPETARAGARWVREEMERAFPEAHAAPEAYWPLVEGLQNDPKDRHVLAAAIVTRVDVLVTANLKDFPQEVCKKYDIEVIDPDSFLVHQLSLEPERVVKALRELATMRHAPLDTPKGIITALAKQTPRFSDSASVVLDADPHNPVKTFRRFKLSQRPPRP